MRRPGMEEWFVVTGANRGLGLALTARLLEADGHVVAVYRGEGLPLTGADPARLLTYHLDLREPHRILQFGNWLRDRDLRLRCLINNAGVCLDGGGSFVLEEASFQCLDPLILEQTFQVNLFGPIHIIQAAYRSVVPGGLVVNITSGLASPEGLDAGWLAYRTSKAALNAMTRVVAKELAARNIRVNAIAPGWLKTAMGGAEAPVEPGAAAEWILGVIQSLHEGLVDTGTVVSFDA